MGVGVGMELSFDPSPGRGVGSMPYSTTVEHPRSAPRYLDGLGVALIPSGVVGPGQTDEECR